MFIMFINERWAICRARNDHENKNLMENIEEGYYEDDDESGEKLMNKKSKDTLYMNGENITIT